MSTNDPRTLTVSPAEDSQAQAEVVAHEQSAQMPHPLRRVTDRGARTLPASVLTPPAPPPPPHLDDYRNIVGQSQLDTLRYLAKDLKGKTIKMVNSTAVGGGVAEMLNRLVPL